MAVKNFYTVNGKIRGQQVVGAVDGQDYMLDASGNVVGVYQGDYMYANAAYDGFGNVLDSWNMSTFTNFTWGEGYGYRQTGLAYSSVYVRARHYSNMDAGWTTRDPLWPSEMPYGYVHGRVPGSVDPSGEKCRETCDSYIDRAFQINPDKSGEFIACVAEQMKKKPKKGAADILFACLGANGAGTARRALLKYILCRQAATYFKLKNCSPCDTEAKYLNPQLSQACCDMIYLMCIMSRTYEDITGDVASRTAAGIAYCIVPSIGMGADCIQEAQYTCGDDQYLGFAIEVLINGSIVLPFSGAFGEPQQ
jgi:hypothetical protein